MAHVHLSYSAQTLRHVKQVAELSKRLRRDRIDVSLDLHVNFPNEGFAAWCDERLDHAAWILVVGSALMQQRLAGKAAPGVGRGATWEASRIAHELEAVPPGPDRRILPVLLGPEGHQAITPSFEDEAPPRVDTVGGYQMLLERLRGQPSQRSTTIPLPYLSLRLDRTPEADLAGWLRRNWDRRHFRDHLCAHDPGLMGLLERTSWNEHKLVTGLVREAQARGSLMSIMHSLGRVRPEHAEPIAELLAMVTIGPLPPDGQTPISTVASQK